ncbi:MAG: sugar transferase [Verrucomicrobiales bacterium]|nr:sugar transferase [Verrucomicrobiales bacterium]
MLLAPLLLAVAVLIKVSDGGKVLFSQLRVGQHGSRFSIYKFRTMAEGEVDGGRLFTIEGDPRITALGRILRRSKIDELPQLWNVLKGEMSLVGPRPEVPWYVELYDERQREVLQYRPGITGLATLQFRNEERLLAGVEDPEKVYIEEVIPRKIELNLEYAQKATLWRDLILIVRTIFCLFDRGAS